MLLVSKTLKLWLVGLPMLAVTACGVPENSIEVKTAREAAAANCDEKGKCVKDPSGLVLYNSNLVTENFVLKRPDENQTLLTKLTNLIDEPKLLVTANRLEPLIRGVAIVREFEPCDSPKGIDGTNPTAGQLRALKQGRYKACITYIGEGLFKRAYSLAPIDVDTTPPEVDTPSVTYNTVTPFSANLSWSNAEDNLTRRDDLVYSVYLSKATPLNSLSLTEDFSGASSEQIAGDTSYTLTSLTENTDYKVTVMVTDEAGNESLVGTTSFTTPLSDTTPPAAVITSLASSETSENPIQVTISFSEPVTGFELTDLLVSNASIQNFVGTDATYSLDLLPLADGVVTLEVVADAVQDGAGNRNLQSEIFSRIYDSTQPTVAISSTPANGPTNTSPVVLTFTFTENVTGFDATDITVANANKGAFNETSPSVYTLSLSPTGGAVSASVAADRANDLAGNGNTASSTWSITYDNTAPSLTALSITPASPTNNQTPTVGFTLSEAASVRIFSDAVCQTSISALSSKPTGAQTLSTNSLPEGTYGIYLLATDSATNSSACTQVSTAYQISRTPPGAPINLLATPGDRAVTLTWDPPSSSGSSPITDYVVRYSTNGGTTWTTFDDGVNPLTGATVISLTNGTTYAFSVAAKNVAGTGVYSSNVTGIIPRTVPGAPTGVTGTAGDTQVSLSWTAPSSNGGSAITDYVVQYSPDNGTTWVTFDDIVSATASVSVTGLTNGTAYKFKVAAVNVAGQGTYSTVSAAFTPSEALAPNVTGLTSTVVNASQINLSWTSGGSNTNQFQVAYKTGATAPTNCSSDTVILASVQGSAITAEITSLTAGTQYSFRVCATNLSGALNVGVTRLSVSTLAPEPSGLAAVGASSSSVTLSWASGGTGTNQFKIAYQTGASAPANCSSGIQVAPATVGSGTSYTVTGLTAGTQYSFRLCSTNAAGDLSAGITASGYPWAPNPASLTAVGASATSISLNWSSGGTGTNQYQVAYQSGATAPASCTAGTVIIAATQGSTTSATITGLTQGTQYSFRVCSTNASGELNGGTTVAGRYPLAAAATNFVATAASGTSVNLSWSHGGSGVSGYKIYYSSSAMPTNCSGSTSVTASSSSTSTTVTGLGWPYQYFFAICSRNANNVEMFGATATGYTRPSDPTGFTSNTITDSTMALSWWAGSNSYSGNTYKLAYATGYSAPSDCSSGTVVNVPTGTAHTLTGLSPATRYSIRVCAVTPNGDTNQWGSTTLTLTRSTLPGEVTGLTALSLGPELGVQGRIQLNWNAAQGATGYQIAYAPGQFPPTTCNGGQLWVNNQTSYIVQSLSLGTAYSFRVCSSDGGISYSAGTTAFAVTLEPDVTNLNASALTHTTGIQITWTPGAGSNSNYYKIAYQTGSIAPTDCSSGNVLSVTGTSNSISGLNQASQYSFRVCAMNGSGSSANPSAGVAVSAYPLPPAPTGFTVSGKTKTSISLSWASGGAGTNQYQIAYVQGATPPADCISGNVISAATQGSATARVISGLSTGTEYSFALCSTNGDGAFNVDPLTTYARTNYDDAPNASGLTASASADNEIIELAWTPPGTGMTGYKIAYQSGATAPADCNTGTTLTLNGDYSSYTVGVPSIGTQYAFRVCTLNQDWSPSSGVTVSTYTRAPAATNLTATATSTNAISISWSSGGSGTSAYQIAYGPSSTKTTSGCTDGTVVTPATQGSATTRSISGLVAGTQYRFVVCAANPNGLLNTYSPTVPSAQAYPKAPEPQSIVATTGAYWAVPYIRVSWTSGGSGTAGFRLAYQAGPVAPSTCNAGGSMPSTTLYSDVLDLVGGTQYSFRLCSVNTDGIVSSGITSSAYPSAPPPDLTWSTTVTATSVGLSWSSGGAGTNQYVISYLAGSTAPSSCGAGTVIPANVIGSSTSYSVTGLSPATKYSFRVCATNIENIAGYGYEIEATTLADTTAPTITSASVTTTSPGTTLTPSVSFTSNEAGTATLHSAAGCSAAAISLSSAIVVGSNSMTTSTLSANVSTSIWVKATDASNNSSCTAVGTYIHDNTAPVMPVIADATRSFNSSFTTSIQQGVPVDSNFKDFRYTTNGVDPTCSTGIISSTQPTSVPIPAATTTLKAISCDLVGLASAVATSVYTYDITPPNAPSVSGTPLTGNATPTWSWSSGGNGGNGTYRYKLNDSNLSTGATETTSVSFTPGSALSEATHTFYVQERDAAGNWSTSGSFAIQVVTPPAAPTLSTPTRNVTLLSLSWASVVGATSYNLYWSTTAGVTTSSSKITNVASVYTHTPLTGGTTYYYKLAAVKSGVESALSNEVSASPYPVNVITPIAIEAFPDTSNASGVTWTPRVKFSIVNSDSVGLYSNSLGSAINTPSLASAGANIFEANTVGTLGQSNSVYAKIISDTSYTPMGSYSTKLPANYNFPGINGSVYALARDVFSSGCTVAPGCLVIAGSFGVAGSKVADNIVRLRSDGSFETLSTGLNGVVYSLAFDNSGNLYAGGWFSIPGGSSVNIAKWDGSSWTQLGGGLNSMVYAIAVTASGAVYAGGDFTTAAGVAVNRIAKWEGSSWSALGSGASGTVRSLAIDASGNLFAGGDSTFGGLASYVGRWNGTSWGSLGSGTNGSVRSLVFDVSGNLYLGGSFTTAGGFTVNRVAKWNGSSWSGSALAGGLNNTVNSLAFDSSGRLYAGGSFSNYANKWDGSSWSSLGGIHTEFNNVVHAMVLDSSGNLWLGGDFTGAGGVAPGAIKTNRLAKWDGFTLGAVGSGPGLNGSVSALIGDSSGNLYVGGNFTTVGNISANYIAKWDGATWSTFGSGMNSMIRAFAFDASGNLYAAGDFSTAGGVTASRIAKWNGSTWSPLGTGVSGSVYALAFDGAGNLYVGGAFTTAGGVNVNRIAKWDGSNWSNLGSGMNHNVLALAFDGAGNLHAGGQFTTAGGVSASYIAKWDGGSWNPVGSGVNGIVKAMVSDTVGNIYAGGSFTTAGGGGASRIAKWDGSSWSALGTGLNAAPESLGVDSTGNIYAGGGFNNAGGVSAMRIARWDGSSWSALGSGVGGNTSLAALAVDSAGNVYAGGSFSTAGGLARPNLAKWISLFEAWF